MPRGLNNWTFKDVTQFIKDNGFRYNHVRGSHYFYIKKTKRKSLQACVPFHGAKAIKPRTLKSIIAQSGIAQDVWTKNKRKKK